MTRLALAAKWGGLGLIGLSADAAGHGGRRVGFGLVAEAGALALHEHPQGDGAQPGLRRLEELAAGLRPRQLQFPGQIQVHGYQPLVKTPSRFKSTLATVVQAARSAGSMPGGRGPSGSVARDAAAVRSLPYRSYSAGVEGDQGLDLLGPGRPAQAELQAVASAGRDGRTPVADDPPRQGLGGLDINRIIQGHERLERRVGPHPADRADLAAGGVEHGHRGIRNGPPPERVKAAAVTVLALARRPGALAVEGGLPQARPAGAGRRWARRACGSRDRSRPGPGRGPSRPRAGLEAHAPADGFAGPSREARAGPSTTGDTSPR